MVGEVIAERYELEELVGAGGMSRVYRARDRLLERSVALKILHDSYGADPETIERFRREARAVAQLSHPNLVTVIDRGEADGRQYIVFEYVEGEDLKSLVERSGPLPVQRALELGIEIARGLAFAHRHGLVHRDVKPQNVLLNGDGKAKVTDFGIARSVDVDGMTQTGTILGTSNYISPEQASGGPVDASTDIYSLGVVLYELLTGEVPFAGENFVAVAMRHVHERPPSVLERRPSVPRRVADAVERALAKDPAERFPSMDELVVELEACLDDRPEADSEQTAIVPRRVTRERPIRPRRRAWPAALLLVGLAAIAALVLAVLLLDGSPLDASENRSPPSASERLELRGIGAFDPDGDGEEHGDEAAFATDGNRGTFWRSERYRADLSLQKEGVGLVLDAGRKVELSEVVVRSPSSGIRARIDAGPGPEGPFKPVSGEQDLEAATVFELEDADARYFLVWITEIPAGSRAEINEVEAR